MSSDKGNNDGWVTDPEALFTVIELKGLRPGDEVKLQHCEAYRIHPEWEGDVVVIERAFDPGFTQSWPRSYPPDHRLAANSTPIITFARGWYATKWNIAAWRPRANPR